MSSRSDKVRDLFQQALDIEFAQRPAFLEAACGGDGELRSDVEGLLQALAEASGFLGETRAIPATEVTGGVIDRYRLIGPLGEGGFGVVWRAEQEAPIRREVALKVLKPGMDTLRVVARFEQERTALARMDHPHIASVFDGGTTPSGRPYFVMELVRGEPIDRYCRSHGLGIEERIALLRDVCLAVQHAHQKGVVHRDLKPHNVLVLESDGRAVPKVIDFGIAKALDSASHSALSLTLTGGDQLVGTLEYMAPEQATDGADVDARADVYGLGVVLFELLTGRRPFERGDRPTTGVAGMLDRIRTDDPPRPSVRAAEPGSEVPLPGADRGRWCHRLRGELDWIAMRALAKDPRDRYATPNALAEDLQRFLDDRPVAAGPPTAGYQFRRFVVRHRLAVGAALLLTATMIGGIVATCLALAEAHEEAEHRVAAESAAREEATRAMRALAATRELLLAADPMMQNGPDFTVRQVLDEFAPTIDARFQDDPFVAHDLHVTVGAAYRSAGQLDLAREHLERAIEIGQGAKPVAGPAAELALIEWSFVLREESKYPESEAVLQQVASLLKAREEDGHSTVRVLIALGDICRLQGFVQRGDEYVGEVLALLDRQPKTVTAKSHRALALDLRGAFAAARGDLATSRQAHLDALELRRQALPELHPMFAISFTNLAAVERKLGQLEAAEEHLDAALEIQRRTYGPRHQSVASTLSFLSEVRRAQKRGDEARQLAEEALAIRRESLPAGHLDIASSLGDLGQISLAQGDPAAAEVQFREALALRRANGGLENQDFAAVLQNLGVAVDRQRRHAEAETLYREALAIHVRIRGEAHPAVSDSWQNIAIALEGQRRFADAVAAHQRALELRRIHEPESPLRQATSQIGIARASEAAGDFLTAARAMLARIELMEQTDTLVVEHGMALRSRAAGLLLRAKSIDEAREILEPVLVWCVEHMPDQWPTAECKSMTAECRLAAGDVDSAVELAQDGFDAMFGSPAPADRVQRAAERCIAARLERAARREADGDSDGAAQDRAAVDAARARMMNKR